MKSEFRNICSIIKELSALNQEFTVNFCNATSLFLKLQFQNSAIYIGKSEDRLTFSDEMNSQLMLLNIKETQYRKANNEIKRLLYSLTYKESVELLYHTFHLDKHGLCYKKKIDRNLTCIKPEITPFIYE